MATAGYQSQTNDIARGLVAEVKTLTVDKLKNFLRAEGLVVSGIKSELQIRSIAHIEKHATDLNRLVRLRNALRPGQHNAYNPYPSPMTNPTPASSASPQFNSPGPRSTHLTTQPSPSYNMPYSKDRISFRNSPFFSITRPLTSVIDCRARETTRDTARAVVTLPNDVAERLKRDDNARVMVFCAAESSQSAYTPYDITFPHQVELKCNSDEVKANLRGLKNKPGSTRPADITKMIRKTPNYPNSVEMVYAQTLKDDSAKKVQKMQKFYLVVQLVQRKPIEDLVATVRAGKKITKGQVLREMKSKADDPDIVATSSVLSLKCPLSFTRLSTPCRGIACTHNQCFDVASYLQLQEQAPTWICPICNRSLPWDSLILDEYVDDIVKHTARAIEQVTVEPDGRWHEIVEEDKKDDKSKITSQSRDDDDDDDLVEIPDDNFIQPRYSATPSIPRAPASFARDISRPVTSTPPSRKRPREEVIDLTLSDDDDVPVPKRSSTTASSNDQFRVRPPPDRIQFQLPPLPTGSQSPYNTNGYNPGRFTPSF